MAETATMTRRKRTSRMNIARPAMDGRKAENDRPLKTPRVFQDWLELSEYFERRVKSYAALNGINKSKAYGILIEIGIRHAVWEEITDERAT